MTRPFRHSSGARTIARLIVVATCAVVAGAAAPAAAAWTAPVGLGAGYPHDVGIDRAGRAVVLWGPSGGRPFEPPPPLMVSEVRAGSRRARSQRLAPGASGSRLVVAEGGRAVVAWIVPTNRCPVAFLCSGSLRVATKRPGGRFGAPVTLLRQASGVPAVAIDDAGTVVAAVVQRPGGRPTSAGRVVAVTRRAGARGWRVQTLGSSGATSVTPAVALGRNGAALVAWSRIVEFGPRALHVASRGGHGRFGAPRTLMRQEGYNLAAVLDPAGRGLVAWEAGMPVRRVFSARRGRRGGWSPAVAFGDGGNLRLSADRAGNALAVWNHQSGFGPPRETHAALRRPGGAFSAPVQLHPTRTPAFDVSASGRTVFAWSEGPSDPASLRVATMRGLRPLGGGQVLSTRASSALVAAAASGAAAVVFPVLDAARRSTVTIATQSR